MCGFRATRLAIELERVGPWNDRALVAERVQFRERLEKQIAADAAPADRLHDAGWTEHAEAAVVRFVGGEAGELAVLFGGDDAERARTLEAPDFSEMLFDEVEDVFCGAAAASQSKFHVHAFSMNPRFAKNARVPSSPANTPGVK